MKIDLCSAAIKCNKSHVSTRLVQWPLLSFSIIHKNFPFLFLRLCKAPESGAQGTQVAKKIRKITHKQHLPNGQQKKKKKKKEEKSFHLAILPLILPEPFISLMKVHDASSSRRLVTFRKGKTREKKGEKMQPKGQPNVIRLDL